ncbi:MAG: nucleotidyltransferase family protein [Gelidibacter sp.]
MPKKSQSQRQTIQLIVDILNFETSDAVLKQHLLSNAMDWDSIVSVASKHLVLTSVFCRLQQKSLLGCLPEDLKLYLEELTELNRNRNRSLLNEVQQISKLFERNQIDHVFVKGVALLAGNYFKDIGERMIGDIDILIASKDLDFAFELLVKEGYSQFIEFNYEVKNYRHLPRQISKTRLAAVELHSQLLKHTYNHLIDKDLLLTNKEFNNGVAIPNSNHSIWNAILGQQINDGSYYYNVLKLKGLYDVLNANLPEKKELLNELSTEKHCLRFLGLASIFCPSIGPTKSDFNLHLHKKMFLLKLKFPKLGSWIFKMKSLSVGIQERFLLFFFNKSYREHVIKNKL